MAHVLPVVSSLISSVTGALVITNVVNEFGGFFPGLGFAEFANRRPDNLFRFDADDLFCGKI